MAGRTMRKYWKQQTFMVLCVISLILSGCTSRNPGKFLSLGSNETPKSQGDRAYRAAVTPSPAAIEAEEAPAGSSKGSGGGGFFGWMKSGEDSEEDRMDTDSSERADIAEDADLPDAQPVYRYRLKPGDSVVINLQGAPGVKPVEDIVDENGNIKLAYLDSIPAAGKTSAELEQFIQDAYLSRKIYKNISVSVVLPSKSYFIRGEVLKPGRFPLLSGVSVLQAVAAAGGFNEFANTKRVTIVRNGRSMDVNLRDIERNRAEDISIEEGDVIVVNRSLL